jgi:hypothetical protein
MGTQWEPLTQCPRNKKEKLTARVGLNVVFIAKYASVTQWHKIVYNKILISLL